MRTILKQPRRELGVAVGAVLLLCGLSQIAMAGDAWLAIHLTGGEYWRNRLVDIERITYGQDELYVIRADGTDRYALDAIVRIDFVPDTTTVGVESPDDRPISLGSRYLFQNAPNPFWPKTRIAFDLPGAGRAELKIFDVSGRLIRTLVDEKRRAGPHSVRWDGRDETGRAVPSGVYFYSLTAPGVEENRRMILVK